MSSNISKTNKPTKKKPKLDKVITNKKSNNQPSMNDLTILVEEAKKQLSHTNGNNKPLKRNKKELLESSETIEDRKQEKNLIKKKKTKNYKRKSGGRRTILEIMADEGEDKVIAQKIYIMASKGTSRKDIRKKLNIPLSRWHAMINKESDRFPIYKEALLRGEDYAIEEIEEAMKSSAIGYDYLEETIDLNKGVARVTRKHVKPDVKAGMFILTNKRPEQYKYKRKEVEHNVNVRQEVINYKDVPLDALNELLKAAQPNVIASVPQEKGDKDDKQSRDKQPS